MNTNNRSSGHGHPRFLNTKPDAPAEDTLRSEKIQIERKMFLFSLKENPRGRFLRITEDVGGRRDAIIIPATGLGEFKKVIEDMAQACEAEPSKAQQP